MSKLIFSKFFKRIIAHPTKALYDTPNCAQVLTNLNHIHYLDISLYLEQYGALIPATQVVAPCAVVSVRHSTSIQEKLIAPKLLLLCSTLQALSGTALEDILFTQLSV